jgi:hypothetical protein
MATNTSALRLSVRTIWHDMQGLSPPPPTEVPQSGQVCEALGSVAHRLHSGLPSGVSAWRSRCFPQTLQVAHVSFRRQASQTASAVTPTTLERRFDGLLQFGHGLGSRKYGAQLPHTGFPLKIIPAFSRIGRSQRRQTRDDLSQAPQMGAGSCASTRAGAPHRTHGRGLNIRA